MGNAPTVLVVQTLLTTEFSSKPGRAFSTIAAASIGHTLQHKSDPPKRQENRSFHQVHRTEIRFKAQVVTTSRHAAVTYKETLDRLEQS